MAFFQRICFNYCSFGDIDLLQLVHLSLQGLDQQLFGVELLLDLTELQHRCPVVSPVMGCVCFGCCFLTGQKDAVLLCFVSAGES